VMHGLGVRSNLRSIGDWMTNSNLRNRKFWIL
jgi:hypothetical protein